LRLDACTQPVLFFIRDHAGYDHPGFVLVLGAAELDSLADRILTMEVSLLQRFVDHGHEGRFHNVEVIEEPPAKQTGPHRPKIIRSNQNMPEFPFVVARGASFDSRVAGVTVAAQRECGRRSNGLNARQRAQAILDFLNRTQRAVASPYRTLGSKTLKLTA